MVVTFLGTGTSHGIPVIGCKCKVCQSTDLKDKRFRSSIMLEQNGNRIVIDTGYEFRLQMIRENVDKLDAVLYTHAHLDHTAGLDDLRVFSKENPFPIYASRNTLSILKHQYPYAIDSDYIPGAPLLHANVLKPFKKEVIAGFNVKPIPVYHGQNLIFGYRIGTFAYLTDTSRIPKESYKALQGVKVLSIVGLRHRPHEKHFSFEQAYEAGLKIGADKIYFTHINHETCYNEINSLYPGFAMSAYDGLKIEV